MSEHIAMMKSYKQLHNSMQKRKHESKKNSLIGKQVQERMLAYEERLLLAL